MLTKTNVAWIHRVSVCLAFVGMLWLASCQSAPEVQPASAFGADSTAGLVSQDPPVKPSGPGGGPP